MFGNRIIHCKTCGAEMAKSATACPNCGANQWGTSKLIHCKTCGGVVAKNANVCPHCGAKRNVALRAVSVVLIIFGLFSILSPLLFRGQSNNLDSKDDLPKVFSEIIENSSVSVKENGSNINVRITCTNIDGNSAPNGWTDIISDFQEALDSSNKIALDGGFTSLTAEILAKDGTIIASGSNGKLAFDKYPLAQSTASSSPVQGEEAIYVSAKDLWSAYSDNAVKADGLYKGELLAVTGTISNIGQDMITKAPCVSLKTNDSLGIYSIQCFFPKNGDQTDQIADLSDGDIVTIYGTCQGVPIANVQLSDCYFG